MQFFRIASVLLIVISMSHFAGHLFLIPHLKLAHEVIDRRPANDTEKKLLSLMNHYHKHVGGSDISLMDIQDGLSLSYSLFFLWTGVLNLMVAKGLARNKRLLAQIGMLNAIVMLAGAWISFVYFFWLPLASFLLAAILFCISALRMRREF